MGKYSVGIDYGTTSARALLVDLNTGEEIAVAVKEYPHGVMDTCLPDGRTKLGADWALQHPQDYLDVLKETIPEIIKKAGIKPKEIIGVGIDFTACTMMLVDETYTPLCIREEFENNPHAYVKLWKHHSAQEKADIITAKAEEMGYTKMLRRFGGRVSSEYLLPKIWQVLDEAPDIYEQTYKFIEAADWIIYQLTGQERRSVCCAGYKGMWSKEDGYPAKALLKELDPRLENLVEEKLSKYVYPLGYKAGGVNDRAARLTGLEKGTAVAVSTIDAHAAVPAAGIVRPGKMLMVIGTSTCHMLLGEEERIVPGMCGVVADGIIPGYYGFEAGQACVGDHFDWAIKKCIPSEYNKEAQTKGINLHQLLTEKAQTQRVGEHGLLALDWWNGNRSILMDASLSGMLIGFSLTTKPEDIYRALIEATAFGTRIIIEAFENSGIHISEIIACGGIVEKNPFLMQIYTDITGREIKILDSLQAPALGSAMFGAVAAGKHEGGFDSIVEAAGRMAKVKDTAYKPDSRNTKVYDMIYYEYKKLYNYFGKENIVMKVLKDMK